MADEESKLIPDRPTFVDKFTEQVRDLLDGMDENEDGAKTFAEWVEVLHNKLISE